MSAKFRVVYEVRRALSSQTTRAAKRDLREIEEEAGEYLYGGGGPEKISVRLEEFLPEVGIWVGMKTKS